MKKLPKFYLSKKIFHQWNFYLRKELLLMDPASTYGNNYFHQSSFYLAGKIISINPASI